MKFQIGKPQLLELIGALQNVVSQKPTIPILANFLVEAVNDELVLTATDLTVGIRCYSDAKVMEEGSTTLPARRFFQLARELPEVPVEISTDGHHLTQIVAGASRFKLHGMGREEFPSLPDLNGATKARLPQRELKKALARASFAASREDNRHALTGLFCRVENNTLTLISTDGKRLSKMRIQVEGDPGFARSHILPLKAVEEVIRLAHDRDEEATLYFMDDKIAFEIGKVILTTKLLSGEYPNVEQVIPAQSQVKVPVHREELISLLRQVALFTNEASQSAKFRFTSGELTLRANAMDVGEGKVSMPVNFEGPDLEIAFNPNYVLDVLRRSDDETMDFALNDAYNPGVITDSTEGVFVVMPMRLSDE